MPTDKKDAPKAKGKPIFVGKSALVRLINGEDMNTATIWLVDPSNKTLRPFVSEEQFDKLFDNPQQALRAVVTLSSDELSGGGVLNDYHVLNSEYGINPDGSMKDVQYSPSQLQDRYGQPLNEDGEKKSVAVLDNLIGSMSGQAPQGPTPSNVPPSPAGVPNTPPPEMGAPVGMGGKGGAGSGSVHNEYSRPPYKKHESDGQGGNLNMYNTDAASRNIAYEKEAQSEMFGVMDLASGTTLTTTFVNSLKNKPDLLAFYIGALAYGNYQIGDVVADMLRLQKSEAGDKTMNSMMLISPSLSRNTFASTPEGIKASKDIETIMPAGATMSVGNWDTLKNYNIYNMPDNFYKELVPTADITSPETISQIKNIKSAYYDIMSDLSTAETDQQRAIAEENLRVLESEVLRDFGFQLSSNVNTAWAQLNTLDESMAARGIQNSGIQNEDVDKYLKQVREQNDQLRAGKLSKEESNRKAYYQNYASEEEINALSPADRAKYSLTPSAQTLSDFSISNLQAKFPYLTAEEVQKYHDSVIDQFGNLRSSAYSNLNTAVQKNEADKFAKQTTEFLNQGLNADEKARAQWDSGDATKAYDTPVSPDSTTPPTNGDVSLVPKTAAESTASTTAPTTPTGSSVNPLLATNMSFGSTGQSVTALQEYLKQLGYFPSTQSATGYFGNVTKDAVAKYQKAMGIDAGADAGYWGPKSIAKYSSIAPAVNNATTVPTAPVVSSTPTSPKISNAINTYNASTKQYTSSAAPVSSTPIAPAPAPTPTYTPTNIVPTTSNPVVDPNKNAMSADSFAKLQAMMKAGQI